MNTQHIKIKNKLFLVVFSLGLGMFFRFLISLPSLSPTKYAEITSVLYILFYTLLFVELEVKNENTKI